MIPPASCSLPSGSTSFDPTSPIASSYSMRRTRAAIESAYRTVSLFRNSRYVPRARAAPRLHPSTNPTFTLFRTTVTPGKCPSAFGVSSVEASSTTINSSAISASDRTTEAKHRAVTSQLLYTGTMTETSGGVRACEKRSAHKTASCGTVSSVDEPSVDDEINIGEFRETVAPGCQHAQRRPVGARLDLGALERRDEAAIGDRAVQRAGDVLTIETVAYFARPEPRQI